MLQKMVTHQIWKIIPCLILTNMHVAAEVKMTFRSDLEPFYVFSLGFTQFVSDSPEFTHR